jgi:hypothetical protein
MGKRDSQNYQGKQGPDVEQTAARPIKDQEPKYKHNTFII